MFIVVMGKCWRCWQILANAGRLVRLKVHGRRLIRRNRNLPETSDAPFGLTVPYQLYKPAIDTLEQLGIPFFSPGACHKAASV
jgi:hypothetical protein